jgi:hypothetical protein
MTKRDPTLLSGLVSRSVARSRHRCRIVAVHFNSLWQALNLMDTNHHHRSGPCLTRLNETPEEATAYQQRTPFPRYVSARYPLLFAARDGPRRWRRTRVTLPDPEAHPPYTGPESSLEVTMAWGWLLIPSLILGNDLVVLGKILFKASSLPCSLTLVSTTSEMG